MTGASAGSGVNVRWRNRRGFSLIEISVCLVILGLLTAVAVLRVGGLRSAADVDAWAERLMALDGQTRLRAEAQARAWRMVFDLHRQQVWSEPAERRPTDAEARRSAVPSGLTISEVRLAGDADAGVRLGGGARQVVVACSPAGVSHSYAVITRGPPATPRRALLFVGGSGQVLHLTLDERGNGEAQLEQHLGALRPAAGDDAD